MKKIATILFGCLIAVPLIKAQTFNDDFESYTAGIKLGPQSTNWTTWSGVDGGTDDVKVDSMDNHTSGGSKSLYFSSTSTTGGPADIVTSFGGIKTSGIFTFSTWLKVPTGKSAYFNFQGGASINPNGTGNTYTLECFLNSNATVDFKDDGMVKLNINYPQGVWFELKIVANLTTNNWSVFIDSTLKGSYASGINKVSFLDLYPSDNQASFWVDDIHYDIAPYTLPTLNGAVSTLDVGGGSGLVGQQISPSVLVKNNGSQAITAFDITFSDNGTSSMQTITGVNIASLTTYAVTIPGITLIAGTNSFSATISNVNGGGPDADSTDDAKSVTFTAIQPAAGKMVATEEATGTWCGWCPRGAVFMDKMAAKYEGYFAGIAVHNNDPMADSLYDSGLGASSYPLAFVDRTTGADPSGMEATFLTRIQIAPKATLVNGATYNSSTRELKVSVTTTFQQAVSGNYRIACAITEDSVTGTTGYAQANYYAGGGSGQMGGFELLGNPVPASQMNYNHVARTIKPSFGGQTNAFGGTNTSGQVITHTFTFVLPSTWDENQIHIVGLFIDPLGKVDNASSTSITEAVDHGYVSGTEIGNVGIAQLDAPDAEINLYPNPASERATIFLNLEKESKVEVAIYQANGALVVKKDYGKLFNQLLLPIEMTSFEQGIYFVHVTINGKTSVQKLVKK